MTKILDWLKARDVKFWVKVILIAVLFIFVGILQLRTNTASSNNNNGKSKVTEKADNPVSENADDSDDEESDPLITPSPIEKADGHGDDWDASKDIEVTKIDSTKAVNCKADDVEKKLAELMSEDGRFAADDDSEYSIRDLSSFANQNPVYNNLFCYSTTVSYAQDTDMKIGDYSIKKEAGDTAYLLAYVSKDGDNAVIHQLTIDGNKMIDDGTVPADASQL